MWSFSRRASEEENFFFVPARNQTPNIVVENPNDLGSRNKTSWCLMNCNCNASQSLFI